MFGATGYTKSIVTHVETSLEFKDFFECFHAARHDGVNKTERTKWSDCIEIPIDGTPLQPTIRFICILKKWVSHNTGPEKMVCKM